MSESLQEAIIAAEKSQDVKNLRKDGYFLNSGISILSPNQDTIDNWILTYYSPRTKDVIQVFIKDEIEIRKPDKPLAPNLKELRLSDVRTNGERMFAKARQEFAKQKKPLSQVIITIQHDNIVDWRFNFITKTLEIVQVSIDATSGAVLATNVTSLVR